MHLVVLSNYCLTFSDASPHLQLSQCAALSSVMTGQDNVIYQNSQTKKSLLIIYSAAEKVSNKNQSGTFNRRYIYIFKRKLVVCSFFFFFPARLFFHAVPAARPGASNVLKRWKNCHSMTEAYWILGKHAWARSLKSPVALLIFRSTVAGSTCREGNPKAITDHPYNRFLGSFVSLNVDSLAVI